MRAEALIISRASEESARAYASRLMAEYGGPVRPLENQDAFSPLYVSAMMAYFHENIMARMGAAEASLIYNVGDSK